MNPNTMFYRMLIGQTIDNKYHLNKLLGAGGYGGVFEADEVVRDRCLRRIALKVIIPFWDDELSPQENEKRQDKQLEELEAAVNYDHPHLIRCYGAGEFQFNGMDLMYLLMELADFSLHDCIRQTMLPTEEREQKMLELSEDEVWQMVGDVASGLEHLHESQRQVHRDLKPGNILRVKNYWKVSDFGLVRSLRTGSYAQTSQIAGTSAFLPPEAFEGKNYPVADTWALGIVVIAALKQGDLPYEFVGETQLLKKVMAGEVVIPALPTRFDDLVRGCLHVDPKQRWRASQVLAAVQGTTGQPLLTTFSFETVTVDRRGEIIKREQRQAQQYIEDLGNGVNLEMVAIRGGTFWMGSSEGEGYDDEKPQHQVSVPPFYMGKYPVTQAQWRAVAQLPKIERDLKLDPSRFKGNNRPVESVSWYDAVEFCARLAKATGKDYHLPSEAQWEYACRAGTTTPFHFGETLTDKLANYLADNTYADEPKGEYREQTTPVGRFPPNAFGLYDMHGNVWEWCADPWHGSYAGAPNDGSAWNVGGDGNRSPLRGGSWLHDPDYCRSAYRLDNVLNRRDDFNHVIGFRVLCVAPRTF